MAAPKFLVLLNKKFNLWNLDKEFLKINFVARFKTTYSPGFKSYIRIFKFNIPTIYHILWLAISYRYIYMYNYGNVHTADLNKEINKYNGH